MRYKQTRRQKQRQRQKQRHRVTKKQKGGFIDGGARMRRMKCKVDPTQIAAVRLAGPEQCHPRVGTSRPGHGCLPRDALAKGGIDEHTAATAHDQYSLLMRLNLPGDEKQRLAKEYLRPQQPSTWKGDPDKWLDSNNIRDVMVQYEEARPDFKFLGPYPIDFAAREDSNASSKGSSNQCLIREMCKLDLKAEKKAGKRYIGIIYNLDPHYKSGSHWVANCIDIEKKYCYYFDSYGMKPPKEINQFMQWLSIQEPSIKLGYNGRRFQKMNTECGIYCLYFIIRMMDGESFLSFCRRAPPDRFMLDLRDWIFST